MARYIDADKLMEEIIRPYENTSWRWAKFFEEIEQMIAEQPAFDTNLKVDDAAVVDRKAVVRLIEQALKDSWKDYDGRLESFAEGLIEKIKQMDSPLDQSLRAAEPAHKDIDSILDHINQLMNDLMRKWIETGGEIRTIFRDGGKEMSAKEMHESVAKLKMQVIRNGFEKTPAVDRFFAEHWMQILDILDDALFEYLNGGDQ